MSPVAHSALQRLGERVDAASLLTDPAQTAAYAVDGVEPAAVVRPGSAEEVAEVVRFAAAENLALVACGARTKLGIGMPPRRYDVALDLTRLNRVAAYDPGDLTLSVEAGLTLRALDEVLARHAQFLPLEAPFASRATVGGTIAAGVDSPLRQGYGTPRDYVLGMEVVTGDGRAAKSGGRVVKNVAGYDLHKLMLGALGTLGVLTRLNFRTFPLPPARRGFLAGFPGPAGALDLRARIGASALHLDTLEVLSPELAQIFAGSAPEALGLEPARPDASPSPSAWTLAASFGGHPAVLERCARDLTRMAEQAGATRVGVLDDAERLPVWNRLRESVPLMLAASPAAVILKVGVLPTRIGATLDALRRAATVEGLPSAALARGAGVIYLGLLPERAGDASLEPLARACAEAFQASAALGGSAGVPWCPAGLKAAVPVWGAERAEVELMRKLKQVFDPHAILSPGRFYGGI